MAKKYYGRIGFVKYAEHTPGDWRTSITEKYYRGDVLQNRANVNPTENVNDDLRLSNKISIVCDSFAIDNSQWIKYVEYLGAMWNVSSIEIQRPRINLTIGGVYNGQQA